MSDASDFQYYLVIHFLSFWEAPTSEEMLMITPVKNKKAQVCEMSESTDPAACKIGPPGPPDGDGRP